MTREEGVQKFQISADIVCERQERTDIGGGMWQSGVIAIESAAEREVAAAIKGREGTTKVAMMPISSLGKVSCL